MILRENVKQNLKSGNGNIVTTTKSVKHNVPIDDKLFAPRQKHDR